MLQDMHDRLQGWVTWIIVIVICVVFALWGVSYYLGGGKQGGQTVAKVNGQAITAGQLQQAYERLRANIHTQGPVNATKLKQEAKEALIKRTLLVQSAMDMGISISQAQVDRMIADLPAFQVKGHFSRTRFQQVLQMTGLSSEGLQQQLAQTDMINQVEMGLALSQFILPREANWFSHALLQTRQIQFVTLSAKHFAHQSVSDTAIKAYYQKHQQQFQSPEQVKLAYLSLSLADIAKTIKVTPEQAKGYYQQNRAAFRTKAERNVSQIIVRLPHNATAKQQKAASDKLAKVEAALKAHKTFSWVAKHYSDDPISAKKGGEMGWIKPGDTAPAFDKIVFGLAQVGAVSKPVKTQYGYQIVKLNAVRVPKQKRFDQVQQQITQQLQEQQAQQRYSKLGDRMANLTFENPGALTAAAQTLKLPVHHTGWFGKTGAQKGIAKDKAVYQAAFTDNVLSQRNNSDVINLPGHTALVIRIAGYKPKKPLTYAEAKPKIRALLQHQAALKQAKLLAHKWVSDLQQGQTLTQLAKQQNLVVTHVKALSRQSDDYPAALVESVFAQPLPSPHHPVDQVLNLSQGDGYVVYQLLEVNHLPKVESDKANWYRMVMAKLMASMTYQQYIASLTTDAHIEIHGK